MSGDNVLFQMEEMLTELYRQRKLRRVVVMDHVSVVNRGEKVFFDRYEMGGGHYQQEPGIGSYSSGYATAGMVVRRTMRHTIAYHSVAAFWQEAPAIGYSAARVHQELLQNGEVFLSNGADVNLLWVAGLDHTKLRNLAQRAVNYLAYNPKELDLRPLVRGDWVECDKYDTRNECGKRGYRIEFAGFRKKNVAKLRYRFLDQMT